MHNLELFVQNEYLFGLFRHYLAVFYFFTVQDDCTLLSEEQRLQLKQLQESKNLDDEVLIPVSSSLPVVFTSASCLQIVLHDALLVYLTRYVFTEF